jgi:FAD-dependent sensor of blue light
MLYTILYTSHAIMNFDRYDHNSLLAQSRYKNKQLEITGMLLYAGKRYIQVLEGEKNKVLSLFSEIKKDTRHYEIRVLLQKDISKREFVDWTMGYKKINKDEYHNIPGLNKFLDNVDNLSESSNLESEAYKLLCYFRNDPGSFIDARIA